MNDGASKILFGPLPPNYGGVSVFMAKLARAAAPRGAEIWAYAGSAGNAVEGTLFLNHRRLGHIAALARRPECSHHRLDAFPS